MKNLIKLLGIFFLVAGTVFSNDANAQCKSFTKKKCMKDLGEYNSNGQYNGAVMFEGEEASLMQTFYSNQDYRLLVCAQDAVGEGMYFEVSDFKKNVIYSSEGNESNFFDFNVESTQQLKIRIVIPDNPNTGGQIKQNGCVSILVGFKNK